LVGDHDYQVILGEFLQRLEYVVEGYLIEGAAVRAVNVEGAVLLQENRGPFCVIGQRAIYGISRGRT